MRNSVKSIHNKQMYNKSVRRTAEGEGRVCVGTGDSGKHDAVVIPCSAGDDAVLGSNWRVGGGEALGDVVAGGGTGVGAFVLVAAYQS